MEKYAIVEPRTGEIIDDYELRIDNNEIAIISHKRKNSYKLSIYPYTSRNYTMYKVSINNKDYILSNIVYSSINRRSIKSGYVIHHKDLNPGNNSIDNLIEISSTEHRIIHMLLRIKKMKYTSFNRIKELVEYAENINKVIQ